MATAASALPVTKFRVPRLRDATVERADLLVRLEFALRSHPLTVLCAPGGSGKTTVLAQLAGRLGSSGAAVVWIAVDEDDDDANRIFATIVQSLSVPFVPMMGWHACGNRADQHAIASVSG